MTTFSLPSFASRAAFFTEPSDSRPVARWWKSEPRRVGWLVHSVPEMGGEVFEGSCDGRVVFPRSGTEGVLVTTQAQASPTCRIRIRRDGLEDGRGSIGLRRIM